MLSLLFAMALLVLVIGHSNNQFPRTRSGRGINLAVRAWLWRPFCCYVCMSDIVF
jgi:hypothetical protein